MFTFEWQTAVMDGAGDWYSGKGGKIYKTTVRADGAAIKFKADMAAEGLAVSCRVCELVSDGKGGKVAKPLFTVN